MYAIGNPQVDASDERIGQRIGQEYLGAAPRVAVQAGVDRDLTRLDTFKAGTNVRTRRGQPFPARVSCFGAISP